MDILSPDLILFSVGFTAGYMTHVSMNETKLMRREKENLEKARKNLEKVRKEFDKVKK